MVRYALALSEFEFEFYNLDVYWVVSCLLSDLCAFRVMLCLRLVKFPFSIGFMAIVSVMALKLR